MDTDFHIIHYQDGSISDRRSDAVEIQDRVWIGANAIILEGVTIGHDSVIGAGAVITKDVSPHSLVVGNNKVVKQGIT